jgi:hypothetical protein
VTGHPDLDPGFVWVVMLPATECGNVSDDQPSAEGECAWVPVTGHADVTG